VTANNFRIDKALCSTFLAFGLRRGIIPFFDSQEGLESNFQVSWVHRPNNKSLAPLPTAPFPLLECCRVLPDASGITKSNASGITRGEQLDLTRVKVNRCDASSPSVSH